ncbi:carbohydrate esterase family 9 protein [Daedaleopsis nitida]|nr:carbohydrate esterase family 9 protein [Daedaleopsis nitida]
MDHHKLLPVSVETSSTREPRCARIATGLFAISGVVNAPLHAPEILDKCQLLQVPPGPPPDFYTRRLSDRFVGGTKPTLIMNATIWTGGDNGLEVDHGDILLDGGLIKRVGLVTGERVDELEGLSAGSALDRIDAQGKWVSPGIVDLHSHLGVYSVPSVRGTSDGNSRKGPVLPMVSTHDDAFPLSVAGGVTTALVLPGSANAIGGQGAVIKLRHTEERSPTSMLLESPWETNTTVYDPKTSFRFRQMKHACGENPDRVYSNTRMDTTWAFRQGYEKARQIKQAQDDYCAKATRGDWAGLGKYPEDLQWEALVDVLRGRVKVHNHCYETVDLDDMVRITNEFEFSIAAFHHAHETYLVPGTLKSAYGRPPAAAMFATHGRYKRESFRGSEFAARILTDSGIQVVMKSDHPVLDSRFLLWEAQQAYYYGLPHNLALASVTTTPASLLGQDHRIGFVKEGYDADLVLWDSHPLALGSTPQQVWIDGIPQLAAPHTLSKPEAFQHLPAVPNFDDEAKEALAYDGLPPLEPRASRSGTVLFANVSSVFVRDARGGVSQLAPAASTSVDGAHTPLWAVVRHGQLICVDAPSSENACVHAVGDEPEVEYVDLHGGSIAPGLTTFGAPLGLEEIQAEPSTRDGVAPDVLTTAVPGVAGGSGALVRAFDGLQFGTRHALYVPRSSTSFRWPRADDSSFHTLNSTLKGRVPLGGHDCRRRPDERGFLSGLSTAFATGARHKLARGAIVQEAGTVHVAVHLGGSQSVSTQIAALRHLLLNQTDGELGRAFERIRKSESSADWNISSSTVRACGRDLRQGEAPLVVDVESADIIASLLALKVEVEHALSGAAPAKLRFTFAGGREAHLLAREIAQAGAGVLLTQPRPFPKEWEARRILPGPPLTAQSQIVALLAQNVTVGIGTDLSDKARNTRFDAAWAALEAGGAISKEGAIALASTNVEKLLGIAGEGGEDEADLVATSGGELLGYGKVVGVISPRRGVVDIL